MNKRQAVARYEHLSDRNLGVPFGWNDNAAWQRFCEELPNKTSREELIRFGHDTGNLSWPETYGHSPWEIACSISYVLRNPRCFATASERIVQAAKALYPAGHTVYPCGCSASGDLVGRCPVHNAP